MVDSQLMSMQIQEKLEVELKTCMDLTQIRKDLGVPVPKETGAMMLRNVGDYMPMKKGGRARKTKGFGTKKMKQANKMRKK